MLNNLILVSLAILTIPVFFSPSYAQVTQKWVQRYNGPGNNNDAGNFIAVDNSGNVYVTGHSTGIGTLYDYTTIKYNSSGTQQWVQRYNGPSDSNDIANCIAVDGSGNVYVTGSSMGSGTSTDYAIVKYNSSGTQQWVQRYNGPGNKSDASFSLALDNSGSVYVTGYSTGIGTNLDYATIKYNSSGFQQWVQRYNGTGDSIDQGLSIAVDVNDNVYVTGPSIGSGTSSDYATIKYSSSGLQQWVRIYNGPANGNDAAKSVVIDDSGNVYVTGRSIGIGTNADYATIKYNFSGAQQWIQRYNGTGNNFDEAVSIAVDTSSNVYVTGNSTGIGTFIDYTTVKYDFSGIQQWVQRYNGPGNHLDVTFSIAVDYSSNAYVTGYSFSTGSNSDYATIKYNTLGTMEWIQRYNGPGTGSEVATSIAVDDSSNVYVTGYSSGVGTSLDYATLKYSQLFITKPEPYSRWISGVSDTIKWTGGDTLRINLKCILNHGTNFQSEYTIATNIAATQQKFVWSVPDTLLSFHSKIIAENYYETSHKSESEIFRVKPYLLTKVIADSEDSMYYEFKKDRDQWGFSNDPEDMWPQEWWTHFDYKGIDPFTGFQYSQSEGGGVFSKTKSSRHPDWISWVNTFTISACYINNQLNVYSPTALTRWGSVRTDLLSNPIPWRGSCFGIATANAIVFRDTAEYFLEYSNFPRFAQPINVYSGNTSSGDTVKKVINELFTHQYGEPHETYNYNSVLNKTPNQTLNEIKDMLISENDSVRILLFLNNGNGGGGHAINVYKVRRDPLLAELYYLYVYDNNYPTSNDSVVIDTSENGGMGSWSYSKLSGWGGITGIGLADPAITYLTNPTLNKPLAENFLTTDNSYMKQSPFILNDSLLQVFNPITASILIKDIQGNYTGFFSNLIHYNIPGSFPMVVFNGSESPPYGYELPNNNYSVVLNNFESDTIETYFFSGNKSFSYSRIGASSSQTDKLHFDGGMSVANTDATMKKINLLNILNESIQEKVYVIRSLNLIQNDSVKIQNQAIDKLKLTSYGSTKSYNIELNLAKNTGLGRFKTTNINFPANTSHLFVPDWSDITNNELIILEDIGNNGTIDDTIKISSSKSLNLSALIEGFYASAENVTIADTIKIYLRNVSSPFVIIDSAKSVLDIHGNGNFHFQSVENGVQYYIVLKHRNSIETWSSTGKIFTSNQLDYDFTTSSAKAFGNNMKLVDSAPIEFAVYGGNVNQDDVVDQSDIISVYNDASAFVSGYVVTDVTGDNTVDLSDLTIVFNNSSGFIVVKRP